MAYLYVNSKGREVASHSYSGSDTLHFCPQKYSLSRIQGWQEREKDFKASLKFGIAMESALRFHHENGMAGGPEEFVRLWTEHKDNPDLKFTPVEHSWENLLHDGVELLKLYHIRLPLFPIDLSVQPTFQVKYWKELFPGTELSGIEFVAYVDMVTRAKDTFGDPLGIDIKTSGAAFDMTENIASLDQQLRTYAWVTGISDWAFLNLQKVGRNLEKGSQVALLEDAGAFYAGSTAYVAGLDQGDENAPGNLAYIVATQGALKEMDEAQGYKNGKLEQTNAAKERKLNWLKENSKRVPVEIFTKQRIQFVRAHIGLEEQLEAARQVGQDVAQIVHNRTENFWAKTGGIRWPNDRCVRCPMRGICLGDNKLRDELLFRTDEDWDIAASEDME